MGKRRGFAVDRIGESRALQSELAGEGDEVGENLLGAGGMELIGGVRAGGDAPDGEAGVLSGLDVPRRVADEEGARGWGAELVERMARELDLRFEPWGVGCAENAVEQRREIQMVADEPGGRAVFVGEDGEPGAAGVETFEKLACAGEEGDVVEHCFVPVGSVNRERFGNALLSDEAGNRELETAADGGVHLLEGRGGESEPLHRVRVGPVDRGEVVDERAVEIEQKRGESGHAKSGSPPASPDAGCG